MAFGGHLLTITLFTSVVTLCSAKQNFKLVFTDIKCTINDNYISSRICNVEKSADNEPKLNIEAQMKKRMKQMRIDYSVNLDRLNKDSMSLYKIRNMDGCTVIYKNITSPFLKMLRDLLLKFGDWPSKCPTPEDYHFKFTGITLDTKYLPSFLPEADFRVFVTLHDKSVKVWYIQVSGKVSHNRRIEGNLKYTSTES